MRTGEWQVPVDSMQERKGDPGRTSNVSVIHCRAARSDAQSVVNSASNLTPARSRCRITHTAMNFECVSIPTPYSCRT
jgi:hypothetical protein